MQEPYYQQFRCIINNIFLEMGRKCTRTKLSAIYICKKLNELLDEE
jgi:hypothetical protein